jgi:hypothetical protein
MVISVKISEVNIHNSNVLLSISFVPLEIGQNKEVLKFSKDIRGINIVPNKNMR